MSYMPLQRRTLRSIGFSLRADESRGWHLYVAVQTVSLALIVAPEMWFVWRNLDDLVLATNALCTVMYCFMSLPKLVTMQLRRHTWYRLLTDLEAMWARGLAVAADERVWDEFCFVWCSVCSGGRGATNSDRVSANRQDHVVGVQCVVLSGRFAVLDLSAGAQQL